MFDSLIARLSAGVRAALNDTGAFHTRAMGKRFVGYGSGDPIQVRSGALRRSFTFDTRGAGLDTELKLASAGVLYARMQEYGGTIRPKNKRYLTIPLPDALTASGVLKGGARLVKSGNKYVTADGEPTFIFKSKRGNLLVATSKTHKLLYVLKTAVTLKPRLGFREVFEAQTRPYLTARLDRAVKEAINT